jgi:predicted aspartyl protease
VGETVVTLTIHGPERSRQVDGLADTAATFTKIPARIAEELGLSAQYETQVELGDGRVIVRPLALMEVEIDGLRRPVLGSLAANGKQPLVGYTTLEALEFKVDTIRHVLKRTRPIEYCANSTPLC